MVRDWLKVEAKELVNMSQLVKGTLKHDWSVKFTKTVDYPEQIAMGQWFSGST